MMISNPWQDGDVVLAVRPNLGDDDLNELFGASWPGHRPTSFAPVLARSLAWIAARRGNRLVGFVNIVGDGGAHAFVLDTTVHPDERLREFAVDECWVGAGDEMRCDSAPARLDRSMSLTAIAGVCAPATVQDGG